MVGLSGCSATAVIHGGKVVVVASTDVYGSIVSELGGDRVDVTSLVSAGTADPKHYEVTAADRTAVMHANLVVYNGGGYDAFMYPLLTFTGVTTVDAAVASGRLPASAHAGDGGTDTIPDGFDAHVFTDLGGMEHVVTSIVDKLESLDPGGATTYAANEATLLASLDALIAREQALATAATCGAVVLADPTPAYLLDASGCVDVTPAAYRAALDRGNAAATTDLQSVLDVIAHGGTMPQPGDGAAIPMPAFLHPSLVAVNAGATDPATRQITAAADAAGVPVVPVSETLPAGGDYPSWMSANLDAVAAALG